ncbi:hypothetical protein NHQ30_000944 [Ciborinia camelliae]|nr:hypothetical protein NHQ30_000944 [Ciborinia camelliae]
MLTGPGSITQQEHLSVINREREQQEKKGPSSAALAATRVNAAVTNSTTTLNELCTVVNVQDALPANGTFLGINTIPSLSSANIVYNATESVIGGGASTGPWTYCNVTVYYTHAGSGDSVFLTYALPAPDSFQNRFYISGGQAYSLATDNLGGIKYGAVSGVTSAGYDQAETAFDEVVLRANGTINWDATVSSMVNQVE